MCDGKGGHMKQSERCEEIILSLLKFVINLVKITKQILMVNKLYTLAGACLRSHEVSAVTKDIQTFIFHQCNKIHEQKFEQPMCFDKQNCCS